MLLVILREKQLLEHFTKKNCKKKKKKSKRVYSWKSNKEKRRETMLNGNATIAILTVGLIKKTL